MLRTLNTNSFKLFKRCIDGQRKFRQARRNGSQLRITEEITDALKTNRPVVALESTIITHGMPHPHNLNTALEVEDVIRRNHAVPATIAIINGNIHIGLNKEELELLSDDNTEAIKTSRRDFPVVLSRGLHGGTTVSGTMLLAHMAGIGVFVTGGIGGVHRGAETSLDISADLTELGRTPVTVISAGVKSILDIGRTLEYLETQGVCVATYGPTCDFPGFFTAKSGFHAPYCVQSPVEAAKLMNSQSALGLQSGILIGVPIPAEQEASGEVIEAAIATAVTEASEKGIMGKEVTPYILQRVFEITDGQSLDSNIALIKNNAKVGAEIAVEFSKLKASSGNQKGSLVNRNVSDPFSNMSSKRSFHSSAAWENKRPVVIGGSNVDFVATIKDNNFQVNGATYPGSVRQSFGGVGRNVAECLSRLGADPVFISAVGDDLHAAATFHHCSHMDMSGVKKLKDFSTATYCAVLKNNGELLYGIGDFDIHEQITPDFINQHEEMLSSAALVCTDGNIPSATIAHICNLCHRHNVPVWYEPTDLLKANKPFKSSAWEKLTYISPNLNELRLMYSAARGYDQQAVDTASSPDGMLSDVLEESMELSKYLVKYIPNIFVTLGKYGVLLCRNSSNMTTLFPVGQLNKVEACAELSMVHYPAYAENTAPPSIVSVSGAGDCMVAAMISGIIVGHHPDVCVKAGLLAARHSIASYHPVSDDITPPLFTKDRIQQWAPWQPHVIAGQDSSVDDVTMWANR